METYVRDKTYSVGRPLYYKQDRWNNRTVSDQKIWTGRMTNTLNGFKNPKWKEQVKNLQNASTNADGVFTTISGELKDGYHLVVYRSNGLSLSDQPCRCRLTGSYAWYLASQSTYGLSSNFWPVTLTAAVADNRARTSFFKQIRNAQTAFSGLTFLGEARESLKMIRHPGQGLANLLGHYVDRVKKRKKVRPKSWKNDLSSLWLESMFGWAPLWQDLQGAVKAYHSILRPKSVPLSAFGVESKFVENSVNKSNAYTGGFVPLLFTRVRNEYAFVKYKGVYVYSSEDNRRVDASAHFGFTMSEFIPTAYQLLPWSFLFDYFSNLGDVLESTFTSTANLAWVAKSTVLGNQLTYHVSLDEATAKADQYFLECANVSSSVSLRRGVWKREASASLSVPDIQLELPGKPAQWANMLALFSQAYAIHQQTPFGHKARRF